MGFLKRIFKNEIPSLLAFPALIWQVFFIYVPLFLLILYSVVEYFPDQNKISFTLSYYISSFSFVYLKIIFNSFVMALLTSVVCLIIAYPVAYFLAFKTYSRFKTLLLVSLILPSWINLIVQIYAWFFLLEKNGIFSSLFYKLGIISKPLHLLDNYFAIMIGMVYCFLPFMILPIYSVLSKMNTSLLEASADLGANHIQSIKSVIFPISLSGVASGFLLVFIPAFGEFAIPDLLGGAKSMFFGNLIVNKFLLSRNWKSGSALSSVGVFFIIIVISLIYLIYKFKRTKAELNIKKMLKIKR